MDKSEFFLGVGLTLIVLGGGGANLQWDTKFRKSARVCTIKTIRIGLLDNPIICRYTITSLSYEEVYRRKWRIHPILSNKERTL